jgi:hypothetical protein
MRKNKVAPDSQTYTALIGMCARAAVEEASFNQAAGTESNTMVQKAWELLGEREPGSWWVRESARARVRARERERERERERASEPERERESFIRNWAAPAHGLGITMMGMMASRTWAS